MAMTKESMADRIQAAMLVIGDFQSEGGTPDPVAKSRIYLEAWTQAIIDEIVANAVVTVNPTTHIGGVDS